MGVYNDDSSFHTEGLAQHTSSRGPAPYFHLSRFLSAFFPLTLAAIDLFPPPPRR